MQGSKQVSFKFANAFERGVQRGPRPLGVHSSIAGGLSIID